MYLRLEREEVDEERRTLEDDREGGEGECSRLCPRSRGGLLDLNRGGARGERPGVIKGQGVVHIKAGGGAGHRLVVVVAVKNTTPSRVFAAWEMRM